MASATGVIKRMAIAGTPAGGTMMTGFTTARIMPYWCQVAVRTGGCKGIVISTGCPSSCIVTGRTWSWIMVGGYFVAIRTNRHAGMVDSYL